MAQNVFEFTDSGWGAAAATLLQSKVDFRKLNPNGGKGSKYVNHVRRMNLRLTFTLNVVGTAGHTVTIKPDLLFGNLLFNTPSAPRSPWNMVLSYLPPLFRLEHAGRLPDAYITGQGGIATLATDLWDGHTYTLVGASDTVVITLNFPFEFYRPLAANPNDGVFPVSIIQDASFGVAYNGTPTAARLAGTAGGDTINSVSAGSAVLSVEMIALPKVQIPSWTAWVQDIINNVQPTGFQVIDGLTVASGIVPQTASNQIATTDMTLMGFSNASDGPITVPGTSVQTYYDRFNQDAQTEFLTHTAVAPGRSQPLPLTFVQRTVDGQKASEDVENASTVPVFMFDTVANTYVLLRRIQMAHGASGQNFATLKSAAGVAPAAQGAPQTAKGSPATNRRVKAIQPYHFAVPARK